MNTTPDKILSLTNQVIAHWQRVLEQHGLPTMTVRADSACFEIQFDPADQSENWFGEWRDRVGMKQGEITWRDDGSVFCEYDVLRPHPQKPGKLIESITSWGKVDDLKTEFRLLDIPE